VGGGQVDDLAVRHGLAVALSGKSPPSVGSDARDERATNVRTTTVAVEVARSVRGLALVAENRR